MKSLDPASLQNLNDIVLPAQVSWWPLASGWYFLFAVLLILFAWFGYRSLTRWSGNRYRRAALAEFQSVEQDLQDTAVRDDCLRKIPVLIKRTALSAYPRNQVASLTGKDWHQFLNSKLKNQPFTDSVAGTLDRVSYSAGDLTDLDPQSVTALLKATYHCLKHHRTASAPTDSKET